jgi:hypothetical protein
MRGFKSYKKLTGFENVAAYESKIEINYQVIGSPDWFDKYFDPGVVESDHLLLVNSPTDLDPIFKYMDRFSIHGYDSETSGAGGKEGLDPLGATSEVVLLQWGVPECIYLIDPGLALFLEPRIGNDKALLIGQNLVFDYEFALQKYNIRLGGSTCRLFDTMLAEQLITAGYPGVRVSIKDLAMKYPPHYIITKTVRDSFANFAAIGKFTKEMLYYAARDVFLLFPIYEAQTKALSQWNLGRAARDEFLQIHVTAEMEGVVEKEYRERATATGIRLDEDILMLSILPYVRRQKEIEEAVTKLYNDALNLKGRKQLTIMPVVDSFDLDSPSQKLEALELMGIKLKDVKRETLAALDSEIAQLLAEYTECQKITSTYGQNLLDKRHPVLGTLIPHMEQMGSGDTPTAKRQIGRGTSTGRYASDIQQIPRPEDVREQPTDEELKVVETLGANALKGLELEPYGN